MDLWSPQYNLKITKKHSSHCFSQAGLGDVKFTCPSGEEDGVGAPVKAEKPEFMSMHRSSSSTAVRVYQALYYVLPQAKGLLYCISFNPDNFISYILLSHSSYKWRNWFSNSYIKIHKGWCVRELRIKCRQTFQLLLLFSC